MKIGGLWGNGNFRGDKRITERLTVWVGTFCVLATLGFLEQRLSSGPGT